MDSKETLIRQLIAILKCRAYSLLPSEFWGVPILKWHLQIEKRLHDLERLQLPEAEYTIGVCLAFSEGLSDWKREHPDRDLTDEEYAWWVWLGLDIGALTTKVGLYQMTEAIKNDYDEFIHNFEKLKRDGVIPDSLSPLEFATLLLAPPEVNIPQIPPGNRFWMSLGVQDAGEWYIKDGLARLIATTKKIKANERAYLALLANRDKRQGMSSKLNYVSEFTGLEPSAEDRIEYLSDSDRLSQFCELAGVDMNTLTDSESSRVLDILHALDTGYAFASKTGVSMAAYYGEKADSEKTQRQRLFKKIKEASDKTK